VIVIPSIPILRGFCALQVQGEPGREHSRIADPVAMAHLWEQTGFTRIHIADLDAATGQGSNDQTILDVLASTRGEIQVGGGVRTEERIDWLLEAGSSSVVVGTRAVEDQWWIEEAAHRTPNELMIATDVRDRRVVTQGWGKHTAYDVMDVVHELSSLPIAGIVVTAVHRQGTLHGPDLPLMEDVVEAASCPVYAAGGVASVGQLRSLSDRGLAGARVAREGRHV